MKNFSKVVVLSVAMLVSAFAHAKNSEANEVATKIGMSAEDFNQDGLFLGKNKKNWEKGVLKYFNCASTDSLRVQILAALVKLRKAVQATLAVNFTNETCDFLKRIDNLIARITSENRFKKAYVELVYNGNPCKLEKREFRKIATKAILNEKTAEAAVAA